ncbi:MAG: DnaA regulatory inactivator Hda [Nevskia sp.]|nr:DnaA regulatory inactivator Hda [Nevskia sp.]
MIGVQLPLSVQLPDAAGFENFHAGPNAAVVAALRQAAAGDAPSSILLHGAPGSGKTHLLQALSRAAGRHGRRAAYLPLESFAQQQPAALAGFEAFELLCLDDIGAAVLDRAWALALLRLVDAVHARGGRCVFGTAAAPGALPRAPLPDLRTRLAACAVFGLKPLAEADLCALLRLRAAARGLELPPEVAQFLLHRLPRDVPGLLGALDLLDRGSLSAQRRLTIPFVQQQLSGAVLPGAQTVPG